MPKELPEKRGPIPGWHRDCRKVPRAAVRQILGWTHVGTPDEVVMLDFTLRAKMGGATEPELDAICRYALKTHHENRRLYIEVQSGFTHTYTPPKAVRVKEAG